MFLSRAAELSYHFENKLEVGKIGKILKIICNFAYVFFKDTPN
jgi:hypothetical protein